jgi:tol-pal system protein YbgF
MLAVLVAAGLMLPAVPAFAQQARIQVAQTAQQAQLNLQIGQLQDQVRTLTGQVEGLQFQLAQMQTLIQKMTEDNEFRFQQLEGAAPAGGKAPAPQSGTAPAPGGAGGKTEAVPQSGGVTPTAEAPQTPIQVPYEAPQQGAVQTPPPQKAGVTPPVLDADNQPEDGLGDSLDPLLGTGEGADPAKLGELPTGSFDIQGNTVTDPALRPDDGTDATPSDAAAQYQAGYDAIVQGDYAFAEDQFRQYLQLYPDGDKAPDATNWLGEAQLQLGSFDDAADTLLQGYQKFPSSPRAPDMLLKLGIALSGSGERDTACRTFGEVTKRYTDLSPALRKRLDQEEINAQCPPA